MRQLFVELNLFPSCRKLLSNHIVHCRNEKIFESHMDIEKQYRIFMLNSYFSNFWSSNEVIFIYDYSYLYIYRHLGWHGTILKILGWNIFKMVAHHKMTNIGILFSSFVQAYTQRYSFNGKIKLIICLIEH